MRLGELLADSFSGEWGSEDGEGVTAILRTANFTPDGSLDYSSPAYRCVPSKKVEMKALKRGDILIEKSGGTPKRPVGIVALFDSDMRAVCSNFNHVLRFDSRMIDPRFAFHQLRWLHTKGAFERYTRKTTGLQNLELRKFFDLPLTVPEPGIQRFCVNGFNLIEEIKKTGLRQLSLLDELVKSRFVEMFGDPDRNDRDFEVASGRDLFEIGNGKSLPVDRRFDDGIPAYGGNGVSWYTDKALIDFDTVVIGRVGRNCGNTRLVKAPLWVTDNAMYIKGFKRSCFDLVFLINLMNVIDFNRFADEGDLWKISQKPFMEYEFPIPPLSLQREFAAFAARVAKSQFVVQRQTKRGFAEFGLRKLIGGLAAVSDLLRISKKIGNHDVRVGEGITLHLLSTIDDYCIPLRNRYRRFLY